MNMKTQLDEMTMGTVHRQVLATSTKTKLLAIGEVLLVFAVVQALLVLWRSTGILRWEVQNLGWSYVGMLILVGIPVLVAWLTRRSRA